MHGMEASIVRELTRTFSTADRQLIMLRYAEQCSPVEISAVLEMSEREVINRLSDIRHRAAQAIAGRRLVP